MRFSPLPTRSILGAMPFQLASPFSPAGDQPEAISQLVAAINRGDKHQTLLGVTGSGKTFTVANVIQHVDMPTLVISHNKVLAAQLYLEFKEFFPKSAVEYFVSFYDFYQPEAYIPSSDTYIEKTAEINEEIDRLRLKATSALLSRRDVIVVASVSCIYNIGSPDAYGEASVSLRVGQSLPRRDFLMQLTTMQYTRNDMVLERGSFRVRGDVIELQPAYDENALRFETFGDELESIKQIRPVDGAVISDHQEMTIFPAKHYVASRVAIEDAIKNIYHELEDRLEYFRAHGKLLEAQRLEQRTKYDVEMLREVGYVSGIENYSRILDGRPPGSRPYSLIDFFKPPFLTVVDESHVTLPQVRGMYVGDHVRKQTLVDHGFRLPCALDNRPLRFEEFESLLDRVLYVSATPADYELEKCNGVIVEQVIRPTGLVDPIIEVRPATGQVDDLIAELRRNAEQNERALITTLTKRMAEDLTEYLGTLGFRVRYMHHEIDTFERPAIIRDLRLGEFDALVGINLLREGLDIPEVTLVAVLDADKEGFLRSTRSLIQIAGRAARNVNGRIVLYADTYTASIKTAVEESGRRRELQLAYNQEHGITPRTIERQIQGHVSPYHAAAEADTQYAMVAEPSAPYAGTDEERRALLQELHEQMILAASSLEFEKAATLRDRIAEIKGEASPAPKAGTPGVRALRKSSARRRRR
jgi:excinuclease ABC subunit B